MPTIYTKVEQRPTAIDLLDAAVELAAHGGKFLVIETDDQAALAGEYRAQAQAQIKNLDTERLEMTEGARKTVERINTRFNTPINELKAKVAAIDKAIRAWMQKKADEARKQREALEAAQREEQLRLEAEARELGIESPPPPPPIVTPPAEDPYRLTGTHGSQSVLRDNWKYRVKDISKVPDHLLVPPEERIAKSVMNATVKSLIKTRLAKEPDQEAAGRKVYDDVIPGIEIYNEPGLASRAV
jgi:hypothetical protein